MTPTQAFKTSFLFRCADEGLTLEQTHARVKAALAVARGEKRAYLWGVAGGAGSGAAVGGAVGGPGGATLGGALGAVAASPLAPYAAVLGLGVPAAAGWLGGKALAESRKDPLTVDEAKANEELAEFQRLTDRARRLKQLRLQQHTIGG